ncbi:MAG: SpoIID/LytB domain-containing protein, partial [Moorella sp. (in: Bacteria)]|nr:SpoIID/LytB domain-containing protein [Moorella sp. (in: firmicutes)]
MAFKFRLVASILGILLISQVISGCRAPARRPAGQEPTISLYINQTGEVKRLKIEEYLPGVVAAEMEPSWPINALAAQA